MDALSIVVSGLTVQKQRLEASASNIANSTTVGTAPTEESPQTSVYRPIDVSLTALVAGQTPAGVRGEFVATDSYVLAYDPFHLEANEDGLVAIPAVDLASESVDILISKSAYKANLSVIRAYEEMQESLLDL